MLAHLPEHDRPPVRRCLTAAWALDDEARTQLRIDPRADGAPWFTDTARLACSQAEARRWFGFLAGQPAHAHERDFRHVAQPRAQGQ